MSGPKVIRIVTEEEKIAICETQIALLDTAIKSLLKYLESHEIKDEKLNTTLLEKLAHYKKLATPEKYREIPGMIQRELDYIASEHDRIRDKELEKAKTRQRRIRNLSESIKTLEMLASSSHFDIDPEVCIKHSQLFNKAEEELAKIERNVSSELSRLSAGRVDHREDEELTTEQKDLQSRLTSSEDEVSITDWKLLSASLSKSDEKIYRLDTIMAELEDMDFPILKKLEYQSQLDSIYSEKSDHQRSLLLDSFVLNLSKESREYKRRQKIIHDLLMIKAQLDTLEETSATRLSKQVDMAMQSEDISVQQRVLEISTLKVAEIITARSINKGKNALIDALRSYGYSVADGMETAVVENGKLVVKKPAEEVYGVEIQNVASTGKFQLRLVSGLHENERSAKDDKAEEEEWCEDLAKIKKLLTKSGVDLEIDKALEPGTATVRYSSMMRDMLAREQHLPTPEKRKLDR